MELEVKLNSTQNWGGAGNGNISITNKGNKILTNWSFQITTTNFKIDTPLWEMNNEGIGNSIIIKPPFWQIILNPGETINSGFSYQGSASFSAISITPGVSITTDTPTPNPVQDPVPKPNPAQDPVPNPNPVQDPVPNPNPNPTPVSDQSRIIGYLAGWKTPPDAIALKNAGYTHIIVAFGVFDIIKPGKIIPAFEMVTKDYISKLKLLGIKVLLSLGGASSSIENTTVDFHKVVSLAPDVAAFKSNFMSSVQNMISSYGFDGIDIDIEHGFNDPSQPINKGTTFTKPIGDVQIMADILNALHSKLPNLLLTLTPQAANVSPSPAFDQTWDNYSALIMLTYKSLSWVGVQLYNTGGCWGIDQIIYANEGISPDFSVALAVDLLENWPTQINGRPTGWNAYIGYLKPNQVVLGYPCPNSQNASDGGPITPTPIIGRAIQCLRSATKGSNSCDTYIPPKTYSALGGVFCWEVSYDQDNNFQFAKNMSAIFGNKPTPTPTPNTLGLQVTIQNMTTNNITIKKNETIGPINSIALQNSSQSNITIDAGKIITVNY